MYISEMLDPDKKKHAKFEIYPKFTRKIPALKMKRGYQTKRQTLQTLFKAPLSPYHHFLSHYSTTLFFSN